MPKLSFVSEEIFRIELEEGTWVDVHKELSYEEFMGVLEGSMEGASAAEKAKVGIRLLEKSKVAWKA